MFKKLNTRFDNVKEPWRLLLFLLLMCPGYAMFIAPIIYVKLFGFVYLAALLIIRVIHVLNYRTNKPEVLINTVEKPPEE